MKEFEKVTGLVDLTELNESAETEQSGGTTPAIVFTTGIVVSLILPTTACSGRCKKK